MVTIGNVEIVGTLTDDIVAGDTVWVRVQRFPKPAYLLIGVVKDSERCPDGYYDVNCNGAVYRVKYENIVAVIFGGEDE